MVKISLVSRPLRIFKCGRMKYWEGLVDFYDVMDVALARVGGSLIHTCILCAMIHSNVCHLINHVHENEPGLPLRGLETRLGKER